MKPTVFKKSALTLATLMILGYCPGLAAEKTASLDSAEAQPPTTQLKGQVREELSFPSSDAEVSSMYVPVRVTWFEQFRDPRLNSYIQQLLDNNYQLRSAEYQVKSTDLLEKRLSASRWNPMKNNLSGFQGKSISGLRSNRAVFQPDTNGVATLDYMNKYKNQKQAVEYETMMTRLERDHMLVSLVSELAETYFSLSRAEEVLALQKEMIANKQEQVALHKDLYGLSLANHEELSRQQEELESYKALQNQYLTEQRNKASDLYKLISARPDRAEIPEAKLPEISVGKTFHPQEVMSDEVLNRQDVLIKFLELKKAKNDINLQWKSSFPTFGVNGSRAISGILNVNRFYYSLGADLLEPLLGMPEAKVRMKQANYDYQSSVEDFKSSILKAFGEVHDLMYTLHHVDPAALQTELEKEKRLQELYRAYQVDVNNGIRPKLDLLKVRESMLKAQSAKLNREFEYLQHCIQLYKSTGGKLTASN